ncbi:MAG: endolytic transglycosylase MltG [Pseudomonadota bacterium]
MWRSLASNMLTFLVVALFLVGGVILWGQQQYIASGPLDQAICIQVKRGSTMGDVSRDLEAEGAVSNAAIFRMGADYADKSSQLKAGSFLIEQSASMEEIVDVVTRGGASTCGTEVIYRIGVTRTLADVRELDPQTNRFVEIAEFEIGVDEVPPEYTRVKQDQDTRFRISMAEGVTSWQVVESLNAMDILTGEVGDLPAEGSLAPDSYEVEQGDDRTALLALMQTAQGLRISDAWAQRAEGVPLSSPEEMVILASIIEKETGVAEERGQVASVFTNRLNRGMRLQTDPTVIYGITNGQGVLGRGLRQSELRRATPYNTYVITGLPPTPIANPGRASLEAAVNPDSTNYVFFVADGTGGHAFAETLEEHNRNVAVWRQIEAERANN